MCKYNRNQVEKRKNDICQKAEWVEGRQALLQSQTAHATMTDQRRQQDQWFKQRLILSVSKPSISQRSQIKEDTVESSVPARYINLWICT